MLVRSEATWAAFKLDRDALLPIPGVTIRDAIWICRANLLDTELQTPRYLREKENYAKLILWGVVKRGILQRERSFRSPHSGARIPERRCASHIEVLWRFNEELAGPIHF